jgi:hypothetical protein
MRVIPNGPTTVIDLESLEIDLDAIYKDNVEITLDGHFTTKYACPVKLAGNERDYRGTTLFDFYDIGGWDAGFAFRESDGEEPVAGPRAYAFKLGVCIHNGTYAQETAVLVKDGDIVILRGVRYVVAMNRDGHIKLNNEN